MKQLFEELKEIIKDTYERGVTLEEAEKLAGRFLHAQMLVAEELQKADLDSRMKKSGTKAIKAAVYLEFATKDPKKPSDVLLSALVDTNEMVQKSQQFLDEAEVSRDDLQNHLSIFKEAHLHFRAISKGRFE